MKVLYTFAPNKSFAQLLDISYIEIWFSDQNATPAEMDDKINLTLVLKWHGIDKMRYSITPRDSILVKGCWFLSFPKNMEQNIGKNISKNGNGKYSQKFLYHAIFSISATDIP